jgi:hypothetical protein
MDQLCIKENEKPTRAIPFFVLTPITSDWHSCVVTVFCTDIYGVCCFVSFFNCENNLRMIYDVL